MKEHNENIISRVLEFKQEEISESFCHSNIKLLRVHTPCYVTAEYIKFSFYLGHSSRHFHIFQGTFILSDISLHFKCAA